MGKKITLREAIARDLWADEYLKELHQALLHSYALKLFGKTSILNEKEIQDLLVFADLMSKTDDIELEHLALEIVICLKKMFPDSHSVKFYKNRVFEELGNYSQFENDDYIPKKSVDSLVESIQKKNEQVLRRFPVGDGYFIGRQKDLYALLSEKLSSFSAPTSMGKSFLMKMFIEERVRAGKQLNFVFLVPTKALITEVTNELCDKLGSSLRENHYRIINHFDSIGKDAVHANLIYVLTPERFEYLLLSGFSEAIDYLFVDEAQNISKTDSRSAVYYRIFDLLQRQELIPKIAFAAPLINNPEIYEKLVALDTGSTLKAKLSPVSQIYFLLDKEGNFEVYDRLSSKFVNFQDLGTWSSNQYLTSLVKVLPGQSLVYRNGINNAINGAKSISYMLSDSNDEENLSLSNHISEQVSPDYYLTRLVKKGVAYHFGKIPDIVRDEIEKAFCRGKIHTLFCTSTLMEGVNLPADNIIIDSTKIWKSVFTPVQFRNLAGRVGRISSSMVGNVFLVANSEKDYKKFKDLVASDKLDAKLSIDAFMQPKVLKAVKQDLKDGNLEFPRVHDNVGARKFSAIRKFSLIYLNDLQNGRENAVTKKFNSKISKEDQKLIRKKFKDKYDDYVEEDVNFSADQSIELEKRVTLSDIEYPSVFDSIGKLNIEGTNSFLRELGKIYNWKKYEPDIAPNEENELVLSDYSELLLHWMNGETIRELSEWVINRRNFEPDFLDRYEELRNRYGKNSRFYRPKNSLDDSNLSIQVLLERLSNIQFKFSNYFLKFSHTLSKERPLEVQVNDWYQYLEYGAIDDDVIWLEKLGYSRDDAIQITKQIPGVIFKDDMGKQSISKNKIQSYGKPELIQTTKRIVQNYPELFAEEV